VDENSERALWFRLIQIVSVIGATRRSSRWNWIVVESSRYFERDIISPAVGVAADGTVAGS
jgi:hypothetical protein